MGYSILIAYFSRSGKNYLKGNIVDLPVGNTEIVAKKLQNLTGGNLFKIDPLNKYSDNYYACTEEAKKELHANARPELSKYLESIEGYETIILAYPNWWGTLPMPVWTFLERYDFSGKTILPLCTNEGSGMGKSETDIKKLCPEADVKRGLALLGSSVNHADREIEDWIQKSHCKYTVSR
jgi:flavodoxin